MKTVINRLLWPLMNSQRSLLRLIVVCVGSEIYPMGRIKRSISSHVWSYNVYIISHEIAGIDMAGSQLPVSCQSQEIIENSNLCHVSSYSPSDKTLMMPLVTFNAVKYSIDRSHQTMNLFWEYPVILLSRSLIVPLNVYWTPLVLKQTFFMRARSIV